MWFCRDLEMPSELLQLEGFPLCWVYWTVLTTLVLLVVGWVWVLRPWELSIIKPPRQDGTEAALVDALNFLDDVMQETSWFFQQLERRRRERRALRRGWS